MKVANIAIWDLETGGLKYDTHALAEIAIIIINSETLEEIDRYEAIVAPYKLPNGEMVQYDQRALDYNGLTMRKIEAGEDARTVAKSIESLCKKHKVKLRGNAGKLISSGHNIDEFDIPFFKFFLSIFKVDYYSLFQKSSLDTLLITRMRWPKDGEILNHKLGTACEKAGVDLIDAHRAMNDVEANTNLVKYFLSSLRQSGGSIAIETEERPRVRFRF